MSGRLAFQKEKVVSWVKGMWQLERESKEKGIFNRENSRYKETEV